MDPSLRKQHDAFKNRAMATPLVEANKSKKLSSSNNNGGEPSNKSRPLKRKAEEEPKQEFDYKTSTGRSENNFAILARIVKFLKTRHLEGDTTPYSLEEIAEEMEMSLLPKHKHWLSTGALHNNPKVEVVDGSRYKFKPIFNIRNGKGLIRLLLNHHRNQFGGIYEDDIEESMPNYAKHKKAHADEIEVITRPTDKKKVLFYSDKDNTFNVFNDVLETWRGVSVESVDCRKVEDYLEKHKIIAMRGNGLNKPVMKKKKVIRKRNIAVKTHNEHIGNVLKDYSEK